MSDIFYVFDDLTDIQAQKDYQPVSRVTLKLDDNNVITAGDDTGYEVIGTCPHATQAMADAILERLRGYVYSPFTATSTGLDPAAELGDGIQAGGVYGVIAQITDDGYGFPDVSSPGQGKLEEAFPDDGPLTTTLNRKIAETNSRISKTAEEISLTVSSIRYGFDTTVGDLQGQITDAEGRVEKLEQSASLSVTQTEVDISIKNAIDGINSITTETGFVFGKEGMTISSSESEFSLDARPYGFFVQRGDEYVLKADNNGVDAKNLSATTYLTVGGRSRFENLGTDRTACFWIGG